MLPTAELAQVFVAQLEHLLSIQFFNSEKFKEHSSSQNIQQSVKPRLRVILCELFVVAWRCSFPGKCSCLSTILQN